MSVTDIHPHMEKSSSNRLLLSMSDGVGWVQSWLGWTRTAHLSHGLTIPNRGTHKMISGSKNVSQHLWLPHSLETVEEAHPKEQESFPWPTGHSGELWQKEELGNDGPRAAQEHCSKLWTNQFISTARREGSGNSQRGLVKNKSCQSNLISAFNGVVGLWTQGSDRFDRPRLSWGFWPNLTGEAPPSREMGLKANHPAWAQFKKHQTLNFISEICSRKGFKSVRLLSWAQLIEKFFNQQNQTNTHTDNRRDLCGIYANAVLQI